MIAHAHSRELASDEMPRSAPRFFLLVFALSVPFWVVGAIAGRQLLPGLPIVDAVIVVCPMLAASILVHRESGTAGVKALLARAFDFGRIRSKAWYAPALLLMPATAVVAYALMRAMNVPLPAPHVTLLTMASLHLAFLVGAVPEELGWSGYATDALQARWSALQTGIILGVVCAAWHVIQLVQLHRPPAWIAWWSLWTVAARVLFVRI